MGGSVETYYISIPIMALCSLIMLVLVVTLIYKLYVLKQYMSLMPFIHIATTICMVACFLCSGLDLYDSVLCYSTDKYLYEKSVAPYNLVNNGIYTIILLCLFGLFIGRLFYTFSNTIYSLSNCFMYFIYFLVLTSIICFIPAEIGYASPNYIDLFSYRFSIGIIIICDTTLNVMCITLFIYKLRQISRSLEAQFINKYQMITVLDDEILNNRLLLNEDGYINKQFLDLDFHAKTYHDTIDIMDKKDTVNDNSKSNSNTSANSIDGPNQMNLINIIIRHTLLSIISIFFNQLWYICLFYATFVINVEKLKDNNYNNIVSLELCLRTIYLLVNCFVLYFNLNINHWLYYSIYESCHLCCYHFCTKRKPLNTPKSSHTDYQQMI